MYNDTTAIWLCLIAYMLRFYSFGSLTLSLSGADMRKCFWGHLKFPPISSLDFCEYDWFDTENKFYKVKMYIWMNILNNISKGPYYLNCNSV